MTCEQPYERLSEYLAGDLGTEDATALERHLTECAECRRRLDALRAATGRLAALPRLEPPYQTADATRRAVAALEGAGPPPEVMTPAEVARFLRVAVDDLEDVLAEVPAFEIAGKLRVRRDKLLAWIAEKERSFTRQALQSEVAGILSGTR
jgi:anti-sigma factor RsiW